MASNPNSFDVLSCIKPTGELHLGVYLGVLRNWAELQTSHRCILGIVDLHAMAEPYDPDDLRKRTDEYYLDLLACGLNPERSTLFVQSLIPEHIELAWILGTITPLSSLRQQFSTAEQNGGESVSYFTHPILQAADILVYKAHTVPVGGDQVRHVSLAAEIAQIFNRELAPIFPVPEVAQSSTPRIRSLVESQKKMSKSLGPDHYIGLFETPDAVRRKLRGAPLEESTGSPSQNPPCGIQNFLHLLDGCGAVEEAAHFLEDFKQGRLNPDHLREATIRAVTNLTTHLGQRRADLAADRGLLQDTIREMSKQARAVAQTTLSEVREIVGVKSISYF
jgi:tryptophanyl-tRNA synthetase